MRRSGAPHWQTSNEIMAASSRDIAEFVIAGQSRSKNGVVSLA
jgi:hypothetical protein